MIKRLLFDVANVAFGIFLFVYYVTSWYYDRLTKA